jgi:hypothetical protein
MGQGMSVRNPITGVVTIITPSGISPRNIVEAWLERLDPDLGEDLGWSRVPTTVALDGSGASQTLVAPLSQRARKRAETLLTQRNFTVVVSEGLLERVLQLQPLWSGTVTLGENPVAGRRYRLVIAEYEEYLVDDSTPYVPPDTAKGRRLVFVEHVELG